MQDKNISLLIGQRSKGFFHSHFHSHKFINCRSIDTIQIVSVLKLFQCGFCVYNTPASILLVLFTLLLIFDLNQNGAPPTASSEPPAWE